MSFPYKNPINAQLLSSPYSVPRTSVQGTNFSILGIGGWVEVGRISDLSLSFSGVGLQQSTGNTIPINFYVGNGTPFNPSYISLNSDNFSSGRRRLGMVVYVYETNQAYQFQIDNYETLWNAATAATNTVVYNLYDTQVKNNTAAGQNFIDAWTASTVEGVSGVTRANARWRILMTGGTTPTLYSGDDTIQGNRVVTQTGTSLTFSGGTGGTFTILEKLEQGDNNSALGPYSHAEGSETTSGIYGYHSTNINNGVIILDSTYGDVSTEFYTYAILDDSDFNNVYGISAFEIDSVTYNGINTIVNLIDTTVTTLEANIGSNLDYSAGADTMIGGHYSHSEGRHSQSIGIYSHSEGIQSTSIGNSSHSEGIITISIGNSSHSEGVLTKSIGNSSHSEGSETVSSGNSSHSEGVETQSIGNGSHSEGYRTKSIGEYSHSEGYGFFINGIKYVDINSVTQFVYNDSIYPYSFSEPVLISDQYSFVVNGDYSFLTQPYEINNSSCFITGGPNGDTVSPNFRYYNSIKITSIIYNSFTNESTFNFFPSLETIYYDVEGLGNSSIGIGSHSEGFSTTSSGYSSHAEGYRTTSAGDYSHSEGLITSTIGNYSHTEGSGTTTNGNYSHAEGLGTNANGNASHSEGRNTRSIGHYSHAEGFSAFTYGLYSHAEGRGTIAEYDYMKVSGWFNKTGTTNSASTLYVIGNGTSISNRSNLATFESSGVTIYGNLTVSASTEPVKIKGLSSNSDLNLLNIDTNGVVHTTNISTGLTINGPISATTYYGDGSNLSNISRGGGGGLVFFINQSVTQGSYREFATTATTTGEVIVSATTGASQTALIGTYETPSGVPGTTLIPSGYWTFYLHGYVENSNTSFDLFCEVYKVTTGGTETLILTTDPVNVVSTTTVMSITDGFLTATTLNVTDRLIVRVKATNTSNQTHTFYFLTEGSQHYSYGISTFPVNQLTFSNGLTLSANNVVLGGTLTANTTTLSESITRTSDTNNSLLTISQSNSGTYYPYGVTLNISRSFVGGSGTTTNLSASTVGFSSANVNEFVTGKTYNLGIGGPFASDFNSWERAHIGLLSMLGYGATSSSGSITFSSGTSLAKTKYVSFSKFDTWPDTTVSTIGVTKTFKGWYSMYGGYLDAGAGSGSTLDRFMYYVAGGIRETNSNKLVITDMMGFYVSPLKSVYTGITNSWGVYQEGGQDNNYFGGKIGIGTTAITNSLHVSAATDPVKFVGVQSSSDTDLLTIDGTGVIHKIATSGLTTSAATIYNSDGTLSGNRVVNIGTNSLNFSSSTNPNTLVMSGGNVGIGTTTPAYKLDVNGGVYQQTYYTDTNNAKFRMGSGYELYNIPHSGGGYEYYFTNNFGLASSWIFNFGDNTNKVLQISSGDIKANKLVYLYSGFNLYSGTLTSFQSSPDVGLQYYDSGSWNFVISGYSGNKYFTINNSGNVGIGTSSPTNKLHISAATDPVKFVGVQTSTDTDLLTIDTTGVVHKISSSGLTASAATIYNSDGALSGNRLVNIGTNSLRFSSSTQPNLFVLDGGNQVGIGTNSPLYKFEVANTGNTNVIRASQNTNITDINTYNAILGVNNQNLTLNTYALLSFQHGPGVGATGVARIGSRLISTTGGVGNYSGDMTFQVNNGTSFIEGIYIKNNANVGFGLTTPSAKVHAKNTGSTTADVSIFSDNFNRASVSPGGTPSVSYSTIGTSSIGSINLNTNALRLTQSNIMNVVYSTYPSFPTNSYKTQLNANLGTLQWAVNTRQSYNAALTGFGAGQLGSAIVLACSGPNPYSTGVNGYALVFGNLGTNQWSLSYFTNGLNSNGNITNIITSPVVTSDTRCYYSLRVTYNTTNNIWSLYNRIDGCDTNTIWNDPLTTSTLIGSATDSTYVGVSLPNFGFMYNSISGNSGFDNFSLINLGTTQYPDSVRVDDGNFRQTNGFSLLENLSTLNFTNDYDAALNSIPLYGLYRNGNNVKIRTSNSSAETNVSYVNYMFSHGSINPGDAQTYYIGMISDLEPTVTDVASRRVICQYNGRIEQVSIMSAVGGTLSTTEASTIVIYNVTQSTGVTINTGYTYNIADNNINYTLSTPLPVNAGDSIQIRWTTPTWVTNPTAVRQYFNAKIRLI